MPNDSGLSSDLLFGGSSQGRQDLKAMVAEVSKQMKDPEQTTFVCVAIAEFLSVYETERLVQELFTLEIDVRNIVVNQLLDPAEADKASLLRARAAMQSRYIAQVEELYPKPEFHITKMPVRGEEIRGIELLRSFSRRLVGKE
eukprot:Plantae.Rhodophyta-Purpureofilum_apyrenoidigerum.ctg74428.p2 GENE.Plantae.Rhodophyta-Purpureofilum_apyrenoidigerum.ctg74428~~Plantae.Rhodophyta-Purpureofilum_apyrenoidigerum.ctg74428.p2  ORF type:complete len:143 (+),score=32.84 Plantae.Rhodophyta-Purpureofilum_apyrenoidigerum.ctg74428:319-747(+)